MEPSLYVIPEVQKKCIYGRKYIGNFDLSNMFVVTLASFVVVSEHADVVCHQGKTVFVLMAAALQRRGYKPNHHFGESILINKHSPRNKIFRPHHTYTIIKN
ncbi:hypothetical protein HB779_19595 [Phyllobacterium sp. 628]|nr:hypothetical protein HB779_19595 [Phyllobacterium sp. 628]